MNKTDPENQTAPLEKEKVQKEQASISPQDIDFRSPYLACLAIISRLLGKSVSTASLQTGIPRSEKGITADILVRAAHNIGIEAKTVHKASLQNISSLVMPCILLLKNATACVLLEIGDNEAKIIMPEIGRTQQISLDEISENYTGYAIFCRRIEQLDQRVSKLKFIETKRWFWGTIWKSWPLYQHVIVASILTNMIVLAAPLFAMNVYDRVIPNNAIDTLWALSIGVIIAYIIDFFIKNIRTYFVDTAGRNVDVLIGSKLLQHLMSARLDHMPDSTGVMANNIKEFEALREFFSSSSLVALIDLPFLCMFIALVYYIGGMLAWPIFVAVPLVIIIGVIMQVPLQYILEKNYKESSLKHAVLFEIIHGLETIKTSMAEGRMLAKWEHIIGLSAQSNSKSKILANISINFSILATQLVTTLVIVLGVFQIAEGNLTMGGLIACNILAGRAMAPLSAVAGLLARFQQSRMALKALDTLMNIPSERLKEKEDFEYENISSSFTFENVNFAYPEADQAVLHNINLAIKEGEKVGFIGRTGAGKSTIGKLCLGLYQPLEGSVSLGGIDLRQMDTADLRRKIGYISQDHLLFYGTLRENIAFGFPEADDIAIRQAADIAGVSDFAKRNPAGFGLNVGERGRSLSGGQRQAVSIARAIVPNPDILIMDEPSSNLDNHSENKVRTQLMEYIQNKTLIIITHRPSMLQLVDRIIIMEQGQIVVDGARDKVLAGLQSGKIKVTL